MCEASPQPLYWETTYEIVLALKENHPDADLENVGLRQLQAWVVALPEFMDGPALADDQVLAEILREWYEEIT